MAGIIEVKDQGKLRIYDADNSHYIDIVVPGTVTANRTITIPDASFTVPQVTNATHSGEVTGATALTIADNIVDEANLKISNSAVNGYMLTAQSGDTGGLTWAAAPAGITSASQFRLSASFNGTADPISSNWEEVDTDGYGRLGTAVSQSSGIFTFPATGIWHIISTMTHVEGSAAYAYATNIIQTTANNSSYADAAVSYNEATGDGHYQTTSASFILDVTNTSNIKARIKTNPAHSSTTTMGDSDRNRTYVTFIRLGDT